LEWHKGRSEAKVDFVNQVWHNICSVRELSVVCVQNFSSFSSFLNRREHQMLVLSRKEGEKIVIGEGVVLTINRIAGNRVAIGIEAPRDIRIVRGELDPLPQPTRRSASGNATPIADAHVALAGNQIH
jgi:carbon storage regulator